MRKHKTFLVVVTILLIVATLEITSPPMAVSAPTQNIHHAHPDSAIICIVAIIIAIVVGVVIWGLIKMCKKIPPPPKPDDDQPTNVTARITIHGPDTFMKFDLDPTQLGSNYLAGGSVTDESGNTYVLMASYKLLCSSSANGPWEVDALITNWMGGTMNVDNNNVATVTLTNQEVALYDTNGVLQAARRWGLTNSSLMDALQPNILMPPKHFPAEFYRLVLQDQ